MSHRPAPLDALDALDAADAAFRLLAAGPRPLGLHASRLAAGLPDRLVPVTELRVLLLHPATGPAARNAVWAEMVRRARAGDPAWTVALAGIAMPGLRRAVASLTLAYRGDPADLQSEVLAAMRALDLDELEEVPLASRLCWAARRADLDDQGDAPDLPWGHPDLVLARAVRRGVLTTGQAELIGRNRLEGVPLSQIAAETGTSHSALCNRRKRAEAAIAAAIAAGELSE